MKILRIVIILLVVVVLGILVYYVTLVFRKPEAGTAGSFETARPFALDQASDGPRIISKFTEYTIADAGGAGGVLKLKGNYQSVDPIKKTINGIAYDYVLGIFTDDQALTKIWLTEDEYKLVKDTLDKIRFLQLPITVTLIAPHSISIDTRPQ
jgi:hypothetical protein